MGEPLAFLLTFRTYGTWLHGDERGSVDYEQNAPDSPYLPADPRRESVSRARMCFRALVLDAALRSIVEAAIIDECRFRGWELIHCAVRTNHVHVVIAFAGVRPELMSGRLKARATRWLRERGPVAADQPVWVDGPGSRRYLWREDEVAAAVAYAQEGQDAQH